jgi:hypothetical protein
MKFYRDSYFSWNKVTSNKLNCICQNLLKFIYFFKNGKLSNTKNAAHIAEYGYKEFWLNDKIYGYENDFTKQSWRKVIKLQVFI